MDASPLLICVSNQDADDLQILKVYRVIADPEAEGHSMVRVIDDSGEDYLYPRAFFLDLPLPAELKHRLQELVQQETIKR